MRSGEYIEEYAVANLDDLLSILHGFVSVDEDGAVGDKRSAERWQQHLGLTRV